jgi:hypothetical protein
MREGIETQQAAQTSNNGRLQLHLRMHGQPDAVSEIKVESNGNRVTICSSAAVIS